MVAHGRVERHAGGENRDIAVTANVDFVKAIAVAVKTRGRRLQPACAVEDRGAVRSEQEDEVLRRERLHHVAVALGPGNLKLYFYLFKFIILIQYINAKITNQIIKS